MAFQRMAGEILALAATFTFVLSNTIFRKVEHQCSPEFINAFRTLIGIVTFFILSLVGKVFGLIFQLSWQIWLILIVSFIFGQVIGDTSYFAAQKLLGSTKALAISQTFPLFTMLLSIIFLHTPFNWDLILSLVLISIGVLLIAKAQASKIASESEELPKSSRREILLAIGLALLASFGWACGLVIIDFATNEIEAQLNIGGMSSVVGNLIRFPAAFLILSGMVWARDRTPFQGKSKGTYGWLLIASIIGTSVGAFLFTEAARIAGATTMSLISSANPLFALPLTYLINREKITLFGLLGVFFIIGGILLILL